MKILKASAALLLVTAIILSGCAAADTPTLNGTSWVMTTLGGQAVLADTTVTLIFEDGQLGGNDGCNLYGTTYQTQGSSLAIDTDKMMSTLMGCPEPVMEQASAFTTLLARVESYRMNDDTLELLDGSGQVLATFEAQGEGG